MSMSTRRSFLSCFPGGGGRRRRRKTNDEKDSKKTKKISYSGAHSESDSLSVNELNHGRTVSVKAAEGNSSVKETLSLSTTSQTHAYGDTTSYSLAGWSNVHPADGFDVSKVNLLPSEESASLVKPFISAFSRSTEWNDLHFDRFESFILRLESLAGINSNNPINTAPTAGLSAFQYLLDVILPHYLSLSTQLGPELKRQSLRVREAFELTYQLVQTAATYSKPPAHLMEEYYRPLSYKFLEIGDFDFTSMDPFTRLQLTTVTDSVLILTWCANHNASVFVKEIKLSANAFANKIFQSSCSSQSKHADWIRSWMACLTGVQEIVDNYFPLGIHWSPDGPTAPMPPKTVPPTLHHDNHSKKPIPRSRSGLSSSKLTNNTRQNCTQEELLCEISHTRRNLRHVPDPDNYF